MALWSTLKNTDVVRLPDPDAWGNYWLRRGEGRIHGPCILHAGGTGPVAAWIASRGGDEGVLFEDGRIRYFASPEGALEALRNA